MNSIQPIETLQTHLKEPILCHTIVTTTYIRPMQTYMKPIQTYTTPIEAYTKPTVDGRRGTTMVGHGS